MNPFMVIFCDFILKPKKVNAIFEVHFCRKNGHFTPWCEPIEFYHWQIWESICRKTIPICPELCFVRFLICLFFGVNSTFLSFLVKIYRQHKNCTIEAAAGLCCVIR